MEYILGVIGLVLVYIAVKIRGVYRILKKRE